MRLINTTTLLLHDFPLGEVPPYAILSHTWDDGEVSFQDMSSPDRFVKRGYEKITRTCSLAREDGLEFAWLDTCCIDKSSSAELGESINSMFQWYTNSVVCYVYLADLPRHTSAKVGFKACRWFTRGWTLQELIAPKTVQFYDEDWIHVGSKLDLVSILSKLTRIPTELLLGCRALSDSSIAARMSWAAQRQTTRAEDMAYCLLGIFEVSMPLIYGEGMRAFRRLQEEIIKRSCDMTIFAWDVPQDWRQQFVGVFAPHPTAFTAIPNVLPFLNHFSDFSATNKGLLLHGGISLWTAEVATNKNRTETLYFLGLGRTYSLCSLAGIYLRKIGPDLYYRDGLLHIAGLEEEVSRIRRCKITQMYIVLDPTTAIIEACRVFRHFAIHIPKNDAFQLQDAIPETLWDVTDRIFLWPKAYEPSLLTRVYPTVLAIAVKIKCGDTFVLVQLLCDYATKRPTLKLFTPIRYSRGKQIIFQLRYREKTPSWEELLIQAPSIESLSESTTVKAGHNLYTITASFELEELKSVPHNIRVRSLGFTVVQNRDGKDKN